MNSVTEKNSKIQILECEGWTRQFVASEPRLSEAVEMYKEAGYEVHLLSLAPQQDTPEELRGKPDDECRACFQGFEVQYKIIFTRPKRNGSAL